MASDETDLPEPDSPTMREHLAGRDVVGQATDGGDRARPHCRT